MVSFSFWLFYLGGCVGWMVGVHRHPYWRVYPWYGRPYWLCVVWPMWWGFELVTQAWENTKKP